MVEAHLVAAAMKLLQLQDVSDMPSKEFAPQGDATTTLTAEERLSILEKITHAIIEKFMSINYNTHNAPSASSAYSGMYVSGIQGCNQRGRWLSCSEMMLQIPIADVCQFRQDKLCYGITKFIVAA